MAEVRAWRWEWVPALLFVFVLIDGLVLWDPGFTGPWLLGAAGLFYVARTARRVKSNSDTGRRNSR